ncbi:MAG: CatB-related O-acetyltransferase [Gammaproteobacteria bacterium]|nr:CatB-related O-acetyltransferase [Gammaproteobacteria bacterium]
MRYEKIYIDTYENRTTEPVVVHDVIHVAPNAKIFKTWTQGPIALNRGTQLGPDVTVGRYFGMNENCFLARATVGNYCAIGARTSINPFNHPTNWLSTHEFPYHPSAYAWVPEYREFERLERTPDMFQHVTLGSDVWMGHNVNVMPGVNVGHGAIIGAGAVVTKDVPPFAIVAGVPATIRRFRFSDAVIERLLDIRWWELELSELSGLPFRDVERCLDQLEDVVLAKREAAARG